MRRPRIAAWRTARRTSKAGHILALIAGKSEAETRRLRASLRKVGAAEMVLPSRFEPLYHRKNDFPPKRHALLRRLSLLALRRSRKWKPSIEATFANFG